jgi:hypothetical protein
MLAARRRGAREKWDIMGSDPYLECSSTAGCGRIEVYIAQ